MRNKKARPGLSAVLMILMLAVITFMALLIVKLYSDKKSDERTISELQERMAGMQAAGSPTANSAARSELPSTEIRNEPQSEAPSTEIRSETQTEAPSAESETSVIYPSYTLDFLNMEEEGAVYSPDASSFGWEEWLWDGCSTWCSVSLFQTDVTASSTLKPQGIYSYAPSNTQSTDRETAWVEGAAGDGVGESIEIRQTCQVGDESYETDIGFVELCIVNGYAATERNWSENNRVRELNMYFDGEFVAVIALEDTIKQQYIDISQFGLKVQNGETASFKFEIGSVYPGTKYDDTCLTGLLIEFTGRTGH